MKVRKFKGASSREALNNVRGELGGDAVILSNRKVAGGYEVLALAEDDMESIIAVAANDTDRGPASMPPSTARQARTPVAEQTDTEPYRTSLRGRFRAPAASDNGAQVAAPRASTSPAARAVAWAQRITGNAASASNAASATRAPVRPAAPQPDVDLGAAEQEAALAAARSEAFAARAALTQAASVAQATRGEPATPPRPVQAARTQATAADLAQRAALRMASTAAPSPTHATQRAAQPQQMQPQPAPITRAPAPTYATEHAASPQQMQPQRMQPQPAPITRAPAPTYATEHAASQQQMQTQRVQPQPAPMAPAPAYAMEHATAPQQMQPQQMQPPLAPVAPMLAPTYAPVPTYATEHTPHTQQMQMQPSMTAPAVAPQSWPATQAEQASPPAVRVQLADAPEMAAEMKAMRAFFQLQMATLARASAAQKALAERELVMENARLTAEVGTLRNLVEQGIAGLAWNDAMRKHPLRAELTRRCLQAGFSATLARNIAETAPSDLGAGDAARWIATVLQRGLVVPSAEALVEGGGMYALVGATGVGKTATVCKLAARCAAKFGAKRVALLTFEQARAGEYDRLRAFARMLGTSVQTITDSASLHAALRLCADKHLVLIDTVGMAPRDARLREQIACFAGTPVQRVLVLDATTQAEGIEGAIETHRGAGLAGCILSKLDEAVKLGGALDAVIRHRLPVHYVANGQRVPDDLHAPSAQYLTHRALRAATPGALVMSDDELGLANGSSWHASAAHAS